MAAVSRVNFGPKSFSGFSYFFNSTSYVKFLTENVFADAPGLMLQYQPSALAQKGRSVYEFCGRDQTIGSFGNYAGTVQGSSFVAVTSDAPATVTLTTQNAALRRDSLEFQGYMGYHYNGAGTNLLCNMKSTARGDFRVSSGVAGFDWGAAWGGTNIVVDGTGTLYVSADSAPAFGAKAVAKTSGVTLTLRDSGKLYLEGGETFVGWAIRDGEDIPRGTYTAANCDWIEGEGSLRVLRDHAGIVLIVR